MPNDWPFGREFPSSPASLDETSRVAPSRSCRNSCIHSWDSDWLQCSCSWPDSCTTYTRQSLRRDSVDDSHSFIVSLSWRRVSRCPSTQKRPTLTAMCSSDCDSIQPRYFNVTDEQTEDLPWQYTQSVTVLMRVFLFLQNASLIKPVW